MNAKTMLLAAIAILSTVTSRATTQETNTTPEWAERRVKVVLKDLSEFARDVDSGARTLGRAHEREGQPDGLMTELRGLAHEYPASGLTVLGYLRSKDEPLMGRVLAVLSIAQPRTTEMASMLGSWYADVPDVKVAMAAAMGYAFRRDERRDRGWRDSLRFPGYISKSPGWRNSSGWFRMEAIESTEPPASVDTRAMLEGLLKLLNRDGVGEMTTIGLVLGLRLSERKECSIDLRRQVRERLNRSYLSRDEGWMFAMQHLAAPAPGTGQNQDLETLGKGFPGLDISRQLNVLNAIATKSPEAIFSAPFIEDFDKIIEFMAQPPKESGLEMGAMFYFVAAVRARTRADARLKKRLMDNPSSTLRQRFLLTE